MSLVLESKEASVLFYLRTSLNGENSPLKARYCQLLENQPEFSGIIQKMCAGIGDSSPQNQDIWKRTIPFYDYVSSESYEPLYAIYKANFEDVYNSVLDENIRPQGATTRSRTWEISQEAAAKNAMEKAVLLLEVAPIDIAFSRLSRISPDECIEKIQGYGVSPLTVLCIFIKRLVKLLRD